jgi:hypothetical protein
MQRDIAKFLIEGFKYRHRATIRQPNEKNERFGEFAPIDLCDAPLSRSVPSEHASRRRGEMVRISGIA